MARIELENLHHRYAKGAAFAIDSLNLTWADGSANALLGPSGCGKTTLLNVLSGLLQPTGGVVRFDGKDVTRLDARQRHIAQVFQFPVVYDTLSVYDNLAFPLRNAGVSEGDAKRRVEMVAELLEIPRLLKTRARGLSASDKQVLSLGRGIVRETTAAVLLDEPLTVIDPKHRWRLRRKLREVQRETGLTMIYVTHDQHEALTFADHVTVMRDGAVEQTGTPEDLHVDPETAFVGYFIGTPGMNFLVAEWNGRRFTSDGEKVPVKFADGPPFEKRRAVQIGIRPEHVAVFDAETAGAAACPVQLCERAVAYDVVTLLLGQTRVRARVDRSMRAAPGDTLWIRFPEEHVRLFNPDGRRIPKAVAR